MYVTGLFKKIVLTFKSIVVNDNLQQFRSQAVKINFVSNDVLSKNPTKVFTFLQLRENTTLIR